MFVKTGVPKIFKHFTVKHLCRSLFLTNFLKNRDQHRFFPVKFAKFLWNTSGSRFCILQGLCRSENSHTHTRLYVAAAYLFLKYNFVECFFSIDGTFALANYFRVLQNLLYFLYCGLNQPLWKIHGIA